MGIVPLRFSLMVFSEKSFDNNGFVIKMLMYKDEIKMVKVPCKIPWLMEFEWAKMIDVDETYKSVI